MANGESPTKCGPATVLSTKTASRAPNDAESPVLRKLAGGAARKGDQAGGQLAGSHASDRGKDPKEAGNAEQLRRIRRADFQARTGSHRLQGRARRICLQAKDAAARSLKGIEEIESLDNRIEVLPLSRMDDDIRMAAYLKIYYNSPLSLYNPNRGAPVLGGFRDLRRTNGLGISNDPPPGVHPISIILRNGNITLIGVVDTEGDKQLAETLARQVRGAFQVTNQLATIQKRQTT
jgi:hypothetical protein